MPRKPKQFTYNDLSKQDLLLLEYPPTEGTWVCTGVYKNDDNTPCGMINTSSNSRCWVCGTKKTTKTLWAKYIVLCGKVGIDPGTRWKRISAKTGLLLDRERGKWVEQDLIETEVK